MKHKINVSQTRKAELNVYLLGLISKYPCKHFLFCNANRLKPKRINLDFLDVRFTLISLHITKGNVKIPYMLNVCSQFYSGRTKDIPKIQKLSCKVKTRPKRTMNNEVQKK